MYVCMYVMVPMSDKQTLHLQMTAMTIHLVEFLLFVNHFGVGCRRVAEPECRHLTVSEHAVRRVVARPSHQPVARLGLACDGCVRRCAVRWGASRLLIVCAGLSSSSCLRYPTTTTPTTRKLGCRPRAWVASCRTDRTCASPCPCQCGAWHPSYHPSSACWRLGSRWRLGRRWLFLMEL